nr:MAG TPA: hypothetical protein [Caudoviricetes sp.]
MSRPPFLASGNSILSKRKSVKIFFGFFLRLVRMCDKMVLPQRKEGE